jgi:hypothetical protein
VGYLTEVSFRYCSMSMAVVFSSVSGVC